jgi:hypothetical protein
MEIVIFIDAAEIIRNRKRRGCLFIDVIGWGGGVVGIYSLLAITGRKRKG